MEVSTYNNSALKELKNFLFKVVWSESSKAKVYYVQSEDHNIHKKTCVKMKKLLKYVEQIWVLFSK